MLATLSFGLGLVLPHLQPTPAATRLTAHDRMPPPVAMLTREAAAPRRLPRICLTPEAVRAATPPLGTKYRSVVELPVIGEQHFGLSITSDREAQLTLKGAIDMDEPIHYNVGVDGKLEFQLSETTTRFLDRLGTTLLHAEYFKANDSAEITIAPPLGVPVVRVTLMRVCAEADELREAVTAYLHSEARAY
mmetsp:Transcript_31478/g.74833  ORF Transcript_31478/g.74833 Transcript_31478/m.74833 type:complete len:191 (-) Transcript_31478:120-692(-)